MRIWQHLNRDLLGFHLGALPYIAWVETAQVGKGGQDATSKAALTTIDPGLALQAPKIIFSEELLANRGADVLPRKGFIDRSFAVGIKDRIKTNRLKSSHPEVVTEMLFPGVKFTLFWYFR